MLLASFAAADMSWICNAENSYVEGGFEIGLTDSGVEDQMGTTRSTPLMLLCVYWLE
jgi:hypothetical protein